MGELVCVCVWSVWMQVEWEFRKDVDEGASVCVDMCVCGGGSEDVSEMSVGVWMCV